MKVVIEEARRVLEGSPSADDLQSTLARVREKFGKGRARYELISANGAERRRAAESGDIDALQALENEAQRLKVELELVNGLVNKLTNALQVAKAEEAVESLPRDFDAVAELLEAEAEAFEAVLKARAATDARLKEINQARHNVAQATLHNNARLEVPKADPSLLVRFCTVRGIRPNHQGIWGQDGREMMRAADQLGLQPLRGVEAA